MGIAVVASLMVAVPLCIGLSEEGYITIPEAFGQVADTTISITNSSGTFDVPAFTNSTGTYPMSDFVLPVIEPEPVVEIPFVEPEPFVSQPTGLLNIQTYTTPTFPDEYYVQDDLFEVLAKRTIVGNNYDLVEDYIAGEATWTSTIDKIQDGYTTRSDGTGIPTYKNYVLQQSGQKVIFNSNSVGGLVYDLPTCSYSIKENGYNGQTVVPSVSAVATGLVNGEWTNLEVNDEVCNVNVTSNADGITITSTKSVQLDPISVFNSVNGTSTLVPQSETFVQVLEVDSKSGIKETWQVWKTDDTPLGISQTVHSGSTIEIAGQVIDIEALNGQSFDRQYIVDNQAEILAITDSVNYDFDEGIDSLTGVNILYDSDYKVNLDYASGNFVGYLEIDPNFTYTTSTHGYVSGTSCSSMTNWSSNTAIFAAKHQNGSWCYKGVMEWDISSIPSDATVSDVSMVLTMDGTMTTGGWNQDSHDFVALMNHRPADNVSGGIGNIGSDLASGTVYVNSVPNDRVAGTDYTYDLGSAGLTDLTTQLSNGWFAVGMVIENESNGNNIQYGANSASDKRDLLVTYVIPSIMADPPTSLSATTGLPIGLTWTAPTNFGFDDGGNAVTSLDGYKVARTQSANSLVELPDNSGTNANLDFTDNEFLLHGFESVTNNLGTESNTNVNDVAHFEGTIGANRVMGQQITSGNVLIGTQIDSLSFWLYKLNSGSSGTETFTFGIWDSSGNLQHSFGTVTRGEIPQGSYPTTGAQKFTESTGSYTLQVDDIVGIRTDTNPNSAWTVELTQRDSDVYSNGQRAIFTQGSTPTTSTKDIGFEVSYSETVTALSDKSTNNVSVTIGQTADTSNALYDNLSDTTGGQSLFTGSDVIGSAQINSGSTLIGTTVFALEIPLFGQGSPTGEAIGGVFDSSGNLLHEFNRVDVSTLQTQSSVMSAPFPTFTFEGTAGYTLSSGENIGVKFEPTGTSNTSHRIFTRTSSSDNFDGSNTSYGARSVSGWTYQTSALDFAFKLYGGGSVSTSTTGVIGQGVQNPDLSFTDSNLPDGTDDFSIGSWVKVVAPYTSPDNIVIDWDGVGTNSDHYAKVDLGSALSDTQWTLRFTNTINNISPSGGYAGDWIVVGLGDSPSTPATSTGQDFIGVLFRDDNGGANHDDIWGIDSDGSTDVIYDGTDTESSLFSSNLVSGTYNVEVIRTSATAYTINLYNADWSSVTDTWGGTTNANNDGLRYFTVDTSQNFNTNSNAYDGQVTNVQVWNGVTSATGTPETFDSFGTPYNQSGNKVSYGSGNALGSLVTPSTELLKFNDVTFNVGTDSASVTKKSVASPTVHSTSGFSWGQPNTTDPVDGDYTTSTHGVTHLGQQTTLYGIQEYDFGDTDPKTIKYKMGAECSGNNCNQSATQTLYIDIKAGDLSNWQNVSQIQHLDANGVETIYEGTFTTSERYVKVQAETNCGAQGGGYSYTFPNCEMGHLTHFYEFQEVVDTPIISATGLADNTSTAKNYVFTRDNNVWKIYQDGTQTQSGGPVFEDVLDSDSFTHTDSAKTSVSGGEFNWEIELDNSDDTAFVKLPELLEEQFVLRFDYTTDSISTTGNPGAFGKFVLSDSSSGQSASFDWIGFERYISDASNTWNLGYGDNTSGNAATNGFSTVPTGTSTYYMEIVRDGTTITGKQYTASDFTGTPDTKTLTLSGTIDGLEYFKFYNRADNSNTGQTGIGSIDNIRIWNGETTASVSGPNSVTDTTSLGSSVQAGTTPKDENQDFCCGNSMSNSQFQKIGMKIEAGHSLIGKSVNKIGFNLNNHQNPDGTFHARIYDSDQSTVLYTFGSISASSIASQSMQYFENTATSYTIEQDDYIVADLIGNTNTGSAPRIDIKYCGDNYGGCPADIAQNISNYEVSGGTWSKSVSPAGSGDELLVFEVYGNENVFYTTNISGMVDEYFINSDALTSTEVNNISTRGVDAWSLLPNPNDYVLLQTDLPDGSVNESGSTGEEIDFTDNEFLIHGFETTTLASAIETHRDSNTWLSLGFKMVDETTNSNNRYIDVSPTEESGTDPTLTIVADGTTYTLVATEDLSPRGDNGSGCASPSSGSILDSSAEWFAVTVYPTTTYNKCVRGMAEFDITSIPTSATITDATMTWKVDGNNLDSSDRIAIYVMDQQGTTVSGFSNLYQAIATGTLVDDTVKLSGTGEKTFSVYDGSVTTAIPDKSTNTIPVTVTTGDVTNNIYPNWDTMVGSGISYDPATHEITKNSAGWNALLLDSSGVSPTTGGITLQWEVDTSWGGYTVGFRDTMTQGITSWDYWLYCGGTSCQFYYNSYNYGNTDEYPTPSNPVSSNYNYWWF